MKTWQAIGIAALMLAGVSWSGQSRLPTLIKGDYNSSNGFKKAFSQVPSPLGKRHDCKPNSSRSRPPELKCRLTAD